MSKEYANLVRQRVSKLATEPVAANVVSETGLEPILEMAKRAQSLEKTSVVFSPPEPVRPSEPPMTNWGSLEEVLKKAA